jgi:DNA-binding phage protein
MPLSRSFKDSVRARARDDAAYRAALLSEVVDLFLSGDLVTGKAMLRDFINATIGFEALAAATGLPAKSLMRMVGKAGNPRADNLFAVLSILQQETGIQLEVRSAA